MYWSDDASRYKQHNEKTTNNISPFCVILFSPPSAVLNKEHKLLNTLFYIFKQKTSNSRYHLTYFITKKINTHTIHKQRSRTLQIIATRQKTLQKKKKRKYANN